MTAQELVDANTEDDDRDGGLAVNVRVVVHPDTDDETRGLVVDDFGDAAGYAVSVGDDVIADPARRWAVQLDSGSLTFVNSDALRPE
ncbi:MAG: hypothetical protein ACRDUB_03395 [Mycobacterium sp.]